MAAIIGSEITPTIAAVFLPEIWAKKAQLASRKEQVLAGSMDTSLESEMSSGRILHIAHVLNLSVTVKSANTIVVPDANTPTNQDITVSRYVYSSFNVEFVTQQQDAYNIMDKYSGQIGYALAGDIESQAAAMPANLSVIVGTYGQELTMDDWETIWQKLQIGLAPKGDRFTWLSSAAVSAIRKLELPISTMFTKSNIAAMDDATLGMFLGFKVLESQYLTASGAGTQCSAHQRQQLILIRQKMPSIERQRVLGDMSDLVVGWELYVTAEREIITETAGAEALNDKWGVFLKTV